MGTDWKYVIEWYPGGSHRQRSAIVITSELSGGEGSNGGGGAINIEIWTNSEVASDIVTSAHPLAVFAKVSKRDSSPVLEARVRIEIIVSLTNGTRTEVHKMTLVDNGNGGRYNFFFIEFTNP